MSQVTQKKISNKRSQRQKTIRAWTFYDWANSVYPLVISSAVFPVYYDNITATKNADNEIIDRTVTFFGASFQNTEIMSYMISFSFLIVAIISPILSGVADYSGSKKTFLKGFCYLGAFSTMGLFLFNADYLEISLSILALASIGYWSSLVFYNAYLPEIAPPRLHDIISAKGFSMGYLGSSILLIIVLTAGMALGMPFEYGFIMTGLWWLIFSHFTYPHLPHSTAVEAPIKTKLTKGFKELKAVWIEFKPNIQLKRFLLAFFLLSMGVQTIMILAVSFAKVELEIPATGLIISVLCIQFVGIAGSFLFANISKRKGNIYTLTIAACIWVVCCVIAFSITKQWQFYGLAALVGLIMGGTQALTRSTYSKMLPVTKDNASYFSFYDVTEKIAIVLGTLTYGLVLGVSNMRYSALAMGVFFVLAIVAFFGVKRIDSDQLKEPS